jgi:hypothetical protein
VAVVLQPMHYELNPDEAEREARIVHFPKTFVFRVLLQA